MKYFFTLLMVFFMAQSSFAMKTFKYNTIIEGECLIDDSNTIIFDKDNIIVEGVRHFCYHIEDVNTAQGKVVSVKNKYGNVLFEIKYKDDSIQQVKYYKRNCARVFLYDENKEPQAYKW